MTPGYTLHTTSGQPKETRGRWVKYRLYQSERLGLARADQINWTIDELIGPQSGRVIEYKIIGN